MDEINKNYFAPQLYIKTGTADISFYEKGFGAVESKKFTKDDGSIHAAELAVGGAVFHLHEETSNNNYFAPQRHSGTTVIVGLFVNNVDAVMAKAIEAGAVLIAAAQSYDYGYRQGQVKDPFGQVWMIEMKL